MLIAIVAHPMKLLFSVLVGIAGAGAFWLGWTAGEPSSVAPRDTTATSTSPSHASAESGRADSGPPAEQRLSVLSPEQTRARAFQILSVSDRLERMRLFSELLLTLTPENWSSIIDAFTVQRRSEGRASFREEANLLFARIGEVCGVAAIDQAMSGHIPNGRLMVPELLQGWAANDPAAAIAWFRARPADQQEALITNLIAGVGCSDPITAFTLLREVPSKSWRSSTMSVIDGVIKVEGIRKADEVHAILRNDPASPPALLREVLFELMQRRASIETHTGDTATLLAWFDPHFPPEVAGDRPDPAAELLATAFASNREGTLAWLDARADRLDPNRSQRLYSAFGKQWAWRGLDDANRWLRSNPHHAQQAVIAGGAVSGLTELRNFTEARLVVENVDDPGMRDQLAQQIEAAEKAQSKAAAKPLPR
jgi:hypothetical protein